MSRWILLRGLTRDSHHWGDFPAALQTATGLPVTALDLPGNGRLAGQRSPARIDALAEHCALAVERLGLLPPFRLVAISLGAMVAIEWARQRPAAFESLTLINASAAPFAAASERLRPSALPGLLRTLLPGCSDTRAEALILARTSNLDPQAHAATLRDWADWRARFPVSRANALRQLLAAARYRAPAEPPHPATRLLACWGDRLVAPACSLRLAEAWQVPLRLHPWAGHDLPLDDPAWLIRQLLTHS
ncbi:MAG: alpha/beta hydrolase [Rhodocyclaceae bacterium]|nr:alpha/beta hydrolase [Rhodocyclaceae bacterium]